MTTRHANNELRRKQILEAAGRVITERGICDARIADIAKTASTSTGLILYYFGTKDQLLADALTYAEGEFYLQVFNGITSLADPRDQLAYLIAASCPGVPEADKLGELAEDWKLWLELWARALHDDVAARKRAALDRRWRATIADIVREGQRRGVFANVDPHDFAIEFAALMDGLALQVVLDDTEFDGERMRTMLLSQAMLRLEFSLDEPPAAAPGG
jgi:AcrR family transcriptional regulator